MKQEPRANLRRTFTPYAGQTTILTIVSAFLMWVAVTKRVPEFFWALAVIWPLSLGSSLYFGLRYSILFTEDSVTLRASGGSERTIRFDEISAVKYEIAKAGEYLSQSRPFRRIAIYGGKSNSATWIDVSLRHFQLRDVEQLLLVIQERRPELRIPCLSSSGHIQL